MSYINKVLSITTDDGRELTGKLIVFDRHMNVVLSDVVEVRIVGQAKAKSSVERKLGLVLLRGEHIVSLRNDKATVGDGAVPGGFSKGTGTVEKKSAKRARE